MDSITSETAQAAFLSQYPNVDAAALSRRWSGGAWLWQQNAVRPIIGTTFAYEVRCSQPQRTLPGEQTSYTLTLRDQPRSWSCECRDWLYRGGVCRHMIACWLFVTYGPRGRDLDLDAWLDRLNAQAREALDHEDPDRYLSQYERSIA